MAEWKKSSFSNGNGGNNCVEVRLVRDAALAPIEFEVRDSKHPEIPALRFTRAEWVAFLEGVKAGEFD